MSPTLPVPAVPPRSAPEHVRIASQLRGRDALLTVEGTVSEAVVGQVAALLRAFYGAGASRMLLDVSRVSRWHASLAPMLVRHHRVLVTRGGRLVVDGAVARLHPELDPPLDELFRIYRQWR